MRLWKYVSTFSNLSGERLHQIYSKLKQEQDDEAGVGPSHANGSASSAIDSNDLNSFSTFTRQKGYKNPTANQMSQPIHKGIDPKKFEAWKRRRRAEADTFPQVQPVLSRPMSNGTRITDPSALGILGAAPTDTRRLNERPYRVRQTGFPPRQGFSSSIK